MTSMSSVGDSSTVVDLSTAVDLESRHPTNRREPNVFSYGISPGRSRRIRKKGSSGVEKFITDDFEMITPLRTEARQGFLDWVAAGGSPTTVSDIEVIYENDDIAVVYHDVQSTNAAVGTKAMCVGSKRDGKFSVWRVASAG